MNGIDQKLNTAETQSNLLAPKLRFKGFEGEWKESELGKLASKITVGIATEVRPFVSDKEDVPLLRNQNIKAGYFDDSSMEYIIPKFDEANKNKRVQSKDVIIVRTGSNMGNACVVPERFKGSQTFTTLIVRPNSNSLNSDFLSYHINYFGLSEIQRLSAGGGKPNLNAGFLKSYRINVGNKAEQQKIASFLSAVDEKIQQLTRKKELLEQYKKGVMQNLFSGELRFKDENGKDFPDWEEKRLGDVANIKRGASPRPITDPKWFDSKSKIGWVRISDVTKSNKYLNETVQYLSVEGIEKSRLVKKGSMIMSICATIGKPIYTKFDVCIHDGFVVFENLQADKEFLYYYLDKIQLGWYRYGQPGSQVNLNIEIVSNESMPYPSIPEQQKIASYLSSIDTKIESVTNQITQTQIFKKGLLQQMFV